MNILGESHKTDYKKHFIVDISADELEHLLGSYYSKSIPGKNIKVDQLKSGDEIDIQAMASMTRDMVSACKQFADAHKVFESSNRTMLAFADLFVRDMNENGSTP